MERTVTLSFSGPGTNPQEAFAGVVADLARGAGIANADMLGQTLIRGLADAQLYDDGGGMARLPGERYFPVSGGTFAAGAKIAKLIATLDAKLAAAPFPIGDCPEAKALSEALASFERYRGAINWATKDSRPANKPRHPARALALHLGRVWCQLTGRKPTAYRSDGKPKGEFYHFLVKVCETFGIDPPKVDVARGALQQLGFIGRGKAE